MSRETENLLLLWTGIATTFIIATGSFTRYVKPSLLPWLAVAAVVLIGLSVVSMVDDSRRGGHSAVDHNQHGHRSAVAWLLVVPVVVLAVAMPPALRAQSNTPTVTAVSSDVLKRAFPPLPPGPAPEVSVTDVVLRAAHDTAGTLDNRTITVKGFTLKTDTGVDLGRILIVCCAADGQLAHIHLDGPAASAAADYPEDTWLSVQGQVTRARDDDPKSIPTLHAVTATIIDPPKNPYA